MKDFLVLGVRKVDFFVALIFGIYVKFLDFLFLDKFTTVLLAFLPPLSTTLFLSAQNTFKANSDNSVVFNRKISYATILLKPWIKHQYKLAKPINTWMSLIDINSSQFFNTLICLSFILTS